MCIAGTPSHWYGVYDYYDEEQHTRHHVVTTYCIECGKELAKTNELEYVEHVFEDGICEKCGFKKVVETTTITREEYEYATRRSYQLQGYADLVKEAIRRGDILSKDLVGTGESIYAKINDYSDVKNGKRKLSTVEEAEAVDASKNICEDIYQEIEVYVELLKQKPEYQKNKSLNMFKKQCYMENNLKEGDFRASA